MAQRPHGKKVSSEQFKNALQGAMYEVFENGGGLWFEVSPLNHEMRVTLTVYETYCLTGSLFECSEAIQSAFTANKRSA
jgi:negative regulator of genetic competence, sporulation and motility